MIFFVSGNDTNIGKTFVSSLLIKLLKSKYEKVAYIKPIESGIKNLKNSDLSKVRNLYNLGKKVDFYQFSIFNEPVAPLTASIIEKKKINYQSIVKKIKKLESEYDIMLIEGAGGLRVPLTMDKEIVDLIKSIKASVLLVISPNLGTLNHTYMSVETLKSRKIKFEGIIINSYPKNPNISNLHNPILINKKKINILGVVPKISKSNQKNKNFRLKSFFHPLLGGQFSQQEFIKKCQDKFNILLKKYAN